MIVFSVFLALFLDGYRSDLKDERELKQSVSNIIEEIKINKGIVEELVTYHGKVSKEILLAVKTSKALDTFKTEYGWDLSEVARQGVFQKLTSQTAWETSKLNNTISHLDFAKLKLLTKTYDQQQLTFKPADQILEILMNPAVDLREGLISLGLHFGELRGREGRLLDYYNEVLEEFDSGKQK